MSISFIRDCIDELILQSLFHCPTVCTFTACSTPYYRLKLPEILEIQQVKGLLYQFQNLFHLSCLK